MNRIHAKLPSSKVWAGFWFALSINLAVAAIIYIVSTLVSGKYSVALGGMPGIGLAYILFLMGCQRTPKYALNEDVFNNRVMWAGIATTFFAVLSGLIV